MASSARRRVLLRDVAEHASVSSATASLVLGGRDVRVSEDTRQRILRAARELDYRPNLMARSLRTQVSSTIGLVADTIITGHYGGDIIRGALTASLEHGHRLLICESEGDPKLEPVLVDDLVARQVDGILFTTASHDAVELPASLGDQRVVLVNCESTPALPSVVPDEVEGGRAAARLLTDAGHRDGIVLVGETLARKLPAQRRLQGLLDVLAAADTDFADRIDCPWWPEAAFDALTAALAAGLRPRALVCLNDRVALGAYQALAAAGLSVPGDVSVVSFDDSELASWLRPALSTIGLPEFEMGRTAVDLLLGSDPPSGVVRLPMPVRERASIAPPSSR
ncbi:LacI family DNA-binding transcriptional regulator [Nocardioides oleivorans]|uniref:LacI family DNA-binding transcriptional regulator n=1 Tax=Nocardioides oleivorans TaxID=273676 RepID=A0A4Q2S283_9ACTN|nr:LacI family DNA-binding transcriptional regulator [Nocardioides oleivorans]RYB94193.1 LacI family DNA-binding transcriptional regulator [Nocardioides oleivorans]